MPRCVWLVGFFKSLLKIIAIILVIIAIIFLIYAALVAIAGGAIGGSVALMGGSGILGASGWAFLAVGLGALAIASIVSPEGFDYAMDRVGKTGSAVGEVIGDVTGGVIGGVAKGLGLPLIALGLGAFMLYRRGQSSEESNSDLKSYDPNELKVKGELKSNRQSMDATMSRGQLAQQQSFYDPYRTGNPSSRFNGRTFENNSNWEFKA